MVLAYLALIELAKCLFYRVPEPHPVRRRDPHRRLRRRAARFTPWAHRPPSGRAATAHGGPASG